MLVSLLVFGQLLGAAIGVIFALWGELSYLQAVHSERFDIAERLHLEAIAKGLRFGMTLLLLASLGLVIEAYIARAPIQPALTNAYWVSAALSLLVIGFSWALSRRRAPFALSSSAVLSGWLFLSYQSLKNAPDVSFGETAALYVISTAVLYAILHYARLLARTSSASV